jgi:hypothetical protein
MSSNKSKRKVITQEKVSSSIVVDTKGVENHLALFKDIKCVINIENYF